MSPQVPSGDRSDGNAHTVDGWTAEEIRRVGYQAVDLIARYLTELPDGPVFRPVPRDLAQEYGSAGFPIDGVSPDAILEEFSRAIAPYPFGNGHPRFYGWVNSPPAVMGIFAEALAAAMNPSVAGGNHAAIYVERQVTGWFKSLIGFTESSMGLLVSGGSVAALTALAVARTVAAQRVGIDVRGDGLQSASTRFVVYKSAEAHACNDKAVQLLGLGNASLRIVDCDQGLRLRPDVLERMLQDDVAAGRVPVAVIVSAGTVNTGAIDPLERVAGICRAHNVWLHVDGAYGAPAILSSKYRDELSALRLADSVAIDPHKWLYVPVEAGLVLIKDARAMRDTFSLVPHYLRTDGNAEGVQGPPWLSEFGIQQTRGFRALKIWMALKHRGLSGYRDRIEHDIALAGYLAERVRSAADLELWEPQGLSIVCFRYTGSGIKDQGSRMAIDDAGLNELNRAVLTRVQLGGEAFLSSTMIDGKFWLRACIVNPLASEQDIDALLAAVRDAGAQTNGQAV